MGNSRFPIGEHYIRRHSAPVESTRSTKEEQAKKKTAKGSWKGDEDDRVYLNAAGEAGSGPGKMERDLW